MKCDPHALRKPPGAAERTIVINSLSKNYVATGARLGWVIAPPQIGRSGVRDPLYQQYYRESKRMNAGFEKLADDFGVHFADAGSWDIDLSADLVHLSEKGHSQFAERMGEYLQSILSADKDSEGGT